MMLADLSAVLRASLDDVSNRGVRHASDPDARLALLLEPQEYDEAVQLILAEFHYKLLILVDMLLNFNQDI